MRLINTETLALEEFLGAVPRYAILSHTWGEDEVTLQDWAAQDWRRAQSLDWVVGLKGFEPGQDAFAPTSSVGGRGLRYQEGLARLGLATGDLRFGYWKILMACLQARRDRLGHLWVDTNCIDKTSSAELSEAINSMFAWYKHAAVCYAYLVDVPYIFQAGEESLWRADSNFRRSKWFTRGWTLQELLAPSRSVFFSRDWTELGTKASLAPLICEITNIPERHLLLQEAISGASLAQRMCWVSQRTVSRLEDIAYCMLGIFDVNMPLIYGEGSRAFIRLQEEIIKKSDDHSIFAWTWVAELTDPLMKGARLALKKTPSTLSNISNLSLDRPPPPPNFPTARLLSLRENNMWENPERSTLLAPDPLNFYDAGDMPVLTPTADVAPFAMTNAGLSISLPVLIQGDGDLIFAVIHRRDDARTRSQHLVCVPLVRHNAQRHRYTRTWFPRSPLVIRRELGGPDPDGGRSPPPLAMPEVRTLQVCRDYQQVRFYYRSFGASAYPRGFWLFYPQGLKGYRVVDGIVTSGGVYSNYGIFFDPDAAAAADYSDNGASYTGSTSMGMAEKSQRVSGGILMFQHPHDKERSVALFLAVRPGYLGPQQQQQPGTLAPAATTTTVMCEAISRKNWKMEFVFRRPLDYDIFREVYTARQERAANHVSGDADIRAVVHHEAPMSQAADSRIFLTEVHFSDGPQWPTT